MARGQWPLLHARPRVQIHLLLAPHGRTLPRDLLADTGAGNGHAGFELLLQEAECLAAGGIPAHSVVLGGAYTGTHPVYVVRLRVPSGRRQKS